MRKLVSILAVFSLFLIANVYSDVTVTEITTGSWITTPSFVETPNGALHCAYVEGVQLKYAISTDGGQNWEISTIPTPTAYIYMSTPSPIWVSDLVIDSSGNTYILYNINTLPDVGQYSDSMRSWDLYCSTNVSGTWNYELIKKAWNHWGSGSYGYVQRYWARDVIIDRQDRVHAFVSEEGWFSYGRPLHEMVRQSDGTWSDVLVLHIAGSVNDTTMIAPRASIDSMDGMSVTFVDYSNSDLNLVTGTTDQSWDGWVTKYNNDIFRYASSVIDSQDNMHVVYGGSDSRELKYAENWGPPITIASLSEPLIFRAMDIHVDMSGNVTVVAVVYDPNPRIVSDVWYLTKEAGGEWSAPQSLVPGFEPDIDMAGGDRKPLVQGSLPGFYTTPKAVCVCKVSESTQSLVLVEIGSQNHPPEANAGGPYTGNEGSPITLNAGYSSDPDNDSLQYRWDFNNDGNWDTARSGNPTIDYTWGDDYTGMVVVEVYDGQVTDTAEATATVINVPPEVGPISVSLDPIEANIEINASANFTDDGELDTHTASWDWGEDNTSSGIVDEDNDSVTGSHIYSTPGVYKVALTVTDDDGGSDQSIFEYIVIYDPSGGFVTGGGWIHSPQGAYMVDTSLTGKATFGFVSKYKRGATVPTGQTQFSFSVAALNFHSTSYEWLVVAGPKAMFKGIGTINSEGNYGFMLSAIDGEINGGGGIDKFRIKIWDKDSSDAIMYDNQMEAEENADPTTAIGGGSIVIHGDPKAAPELLPKETRLLNAYPNPFNPDVWIPYRLSSDTQVVIRIHDMTGRLIRTLDMGYKSAGFYVSRSKAAYWDGANESGEHVASGIYFYTLTADDFSATRKMVVKK